MSNMCEFYDRECIDCGECDICDLDKSKHCDDCGECLNFSQDYLSLNIKEFISKDKKQ